MLSSSSSADNKQRGGVPELCPTFFRIGMPMNRSSLYSCARELPVLDGGMQPGELVAEIFRETLADKLHLASNSLCNVLERSAFPGRISGKAIYPQCTMEYMLGRAYCFSPTEELRKMCDSATNGPRKVLFLAFETQWSIHPEQVALHHGFGSLRPDNQLWHESFGWQQDAAQAMRCINNRAYLECRRVYFEGGRKREEGCVMLIAEAADRIPGTSTRGGCFRLLGALVFHGNPRMSLAGLTLEGEEDALVQNSLDWSKSVLDPCWLVSMLLWEHEEKLAMTFFHRKKERMEVIRTLTHVLDTIPVSKLSLLGEKLLRFLLQRTAASRQIRSLETEWGIASRQFFKGERVVKGSIAFLMCTHARLGSMCHPLLHTMPADVLKNILELAEDDYARINTFA